MTVYIVINVCDRVLLLMIVVAHSTDNGELKHVDNW